MDFFDGRHYKINKVLLSFIGQWPYQTITRRNVTLFILFLLAGTQYIAKMEILIDRIRTDIISYTKADETRTLKKYAEDGRKFTIIYAGFLYGAMVIFMITPLKPLIFNTLNETAERPLIHHVEYFVDKDKYYYFIILHSYVTIVICISVVIATDTMFLVFIQHVCGLFSTLGYYKIISKRYFSRYQLYHLAEKEKLDLDINVAIKDDKPYKNIAECIYRHQKAIEFANLMESYYSTCFFLQAGLIMIAMSITSLQAFMYMDEMAMFLRQLLFSYAQLAHLFFESVSAQRLMDHSSQMHEHLINVQWYQTTIRTRKVINIMLIRSREPCKLTAANMFVISMETFSTVRNHLFFFLFRNYIRD
ncbi:hypothetical protein M0804_012545 [Polistes exclamans]|nr:hypothetical protein M0804_012545 [Polistes exclamans]